MQRSVFSKLSANMWAVVLVSALFVAPFISLSQAQSDEMPAPSPEHGKELFETFCQACHNQHKIVGPPLVEDAGYFIRAGLPKEQLGMLLHVPVRVKREGSIMPAFTPDQVSDSDLMDIGAYIGSFETPPAALPELGSAERGEGLYAQNCALCHGANGEGVAKMAPVAMIASGMKQFNVPQHALLGLVTLSARSGNVGDMPVFGEDALNDQDLADITAYIWELPMPEMAQAGE